MRQPSSDVGRVMRRIRPLGTSLLLIVGSWLLMRRLAGAFERPLQPAGLIATALLLGAWSGLARWAWHAGRRAGETRLSWPDQVFGILTMVGVVVFGAAVSLPGSSASALGTFWSVLLATETVWFLSFRPLRESGDPLWNETRLAEATTAADSITGASAMATLPIEFPLLGSSAENETGELLALDESQRITRARDARGSEVVSGFVRCSFGPHQRQRDIHLAFCPPLKRLPHFSVEQVEGPPARIRASLIETFGVGLEVKLASLNSEPTSVQLQFFACEELSDGDLA